MPPIDMSAAIKAPPRKRGPRAAPQQPQASSTEAITQHRVEGLLGLGQLGQGICLATSQWADAAAIGQHYPPLAEAFANAANGNAVIARTVDLLIEIGPYGAIIAAATPLILQIMANHGKLDANRMVGQGIIPPDVLESQMKAQVAKMQADALRAQQEAMIEASEAQKEYEAMIAEYESESDDIRHHRDQGMEVANA